MDIIRLRNELAVDEGKVLKIYKDHLGYPTFGIGHLVIKEDPEYNQPVGTPVSEQRVNEVFDKDIMTTINDCKKLYSDFLYLPEEAQLIIANMMFNLGYNRLSKFRNMKKAVDERDWNRAADEMMDSTWYKQVTKRADRLVNRMRNIQ